MKRLFQWIAERLTEHVVLQFIGSVPLAYILGWFIAVKQGAIVMYNAIPSLFWPILAVLIVLVSICHGLISPAVKWCQKKAESYRNEVEEAYNYVAGSYRPKILNPAHPGNPYAMKECAQKSVDVLRKKLLKRHKGQDVPSRINVEDETSLKEWHEFLRDERARLAR